MIYLVGGTAAMAVSDDLVRPGGTLYLNWRPPPERFPSNEVHEVQTLVYEPSAYRKAGYSAVYRFRRRE